LHSIKNMLNTQKWNVLKQASEIPPAPKMHQLQTGYTMPHYKISWLLLVCLLCNRLSAQELFVFTEPSSNMPAKSIGIRLSNWFMDDDNLSHVRYHLLPEIMWGVNKCLMLHVEGYLSNSSGTFNGEGLGLYAKYRFYSNDKIYRHFRLAAFGRMATNNETVYQQEIATNGYNTGYQIGLIGTQLLHKTALSVTTYYERALNNPNGYEFPTALADKALNYSLSAGRLILPKIYKGYKQTNMNLMTELVGQTLIGNGKQFADLAISAQFIFNSQTRVDIGYKHELYSNMQRNLPNGLMLRVEHLLYNVL
jgi:hypothetical protein